MKSQKRISVDYSAFELGINNKKIRKQPYIGY